jgi:hypothetical protein
MTRTLGRQRGQALLSALIATAFLLPLGAFAVMQARLDFLVQHHTRVASATLAVAESGLEHALADLSRDPRFDRLLLGPDQRAGTGDDGRFPFDTPPPAFFPAAPFRYEVRVATSTPQRAEIIAHGYGPLGAVRAVAAGLERTPLPYLPAAVASDAARLDFFFARDWSLEGAMASGAAPGAPAMALGSAPAVELLLGRLTSDDAQRLRGPGGSPSLTAAAIPAVSTLVDTGRSRPEAQALGTEVSGALGDGIFVRTGAVRMRDAQGSGLLLIDGALEVSGTFGFDGLIAVAGDLRVDSGADVQVAGAVVQGAPGSAVVLQGRGRIAYSHAVVERLAATYPSVLPMRARLSGWRELSDAQP